MIFPNMNTYDFLQVIKKRRWTLAAIIGTVLAITLIITLVQPLKYQASSRLLIIQDNTSADFYTITKSNQYLGSLLAETAASGSFLDTVSAANPNINWGYFGGTYKQRIEKWKQTISASDSSDTGIIEIDIYHPDPAQAEQISVAVDNLLITQNSLYQSANSNLKIKIIDQPTVSSFPVKPNILINVLGALIFGLLGGLIYLYYFPTSRQKKPKNSSPTVAQPTKIDLPQEQPISYYPSRNQIPVQQISREPQPRPDTTEQPTQEKPASFSGNIRNIVN
jgi:capsular polysaccharide biosynthesis protein